MNRPFFLNGRYITLFHFSITYTKDGQETTIYEVDMSNVDAMKQRLNSEDITDIAVSELDTTGLEWLEGIDVGESRSMEDAVAIWQMGEAEYLRQKNVLSEKERLELLEGALQEMLLGGI